jgi:L-threonylcarbamoyladenylate synthase
VLPDNRPVQRIVTDELTVTPFVLHGAVQAIARGGVVAMPTDTLYGLAVDPFQPSAVDRVFAVKGRAAERALPLVAANLEQVIGRLGPLPPIAAVLAERFWPGPLTLLVAAPQSLPPLVVGGTGRVGVRVPNHRVTRMLCRACSSPLTATSANTSGAPSSADPDEVARALGDRIDVLIDAGVTPGGAPSTIVDATGDAPVLIRAGAIDWTEILATLSASVRLSRS